MSDNLAKDSYKQCTWLNKVAKSTTTAVCSHKFDIGFTFRSYMTYKGEIRQMAISETNTHLKSLFHQNEYMR